MAYASGYAVAGRADGQWPVADGLRPVPPLAAGPRIHLDPGLARLCEGWANYCVSREHTRWVRAVTLLSRFPSGATQPGSAAADACEPRGEHCSEQRANHLQNKVGDHLAPVLEQELPGCQHDRQ